MHTSFQYIKSVPYFSNTSPSLLVTSENGKAVRRRFLDASMLNPQALEQLETRVAEASVTYKAWLEKYVQQMERDQKNLHSQFQSFCLKLSSRR